MKGESATKKDPSVIRVELRYCPRCGALNIGTVDQPFCSLCIGALRWLYAKRLRLRCSAEQGEP
jgi:hypothetical protein